MTIVARRAHSSPERLLQDTAIREREAYLEAVNRLTGPMEGWRRVGNPDEPPFQNGWRHGYQAPTSERGPEWFFHTTGFACHLPEVKGDPLVCKVWEGGWYRYPQWVVDLLGVGKGVGDNIQYPVEFRKDNEGFVYLVGVAGKQGASDARWNLETVFTFPETHRPAYREFVGDPGWVYTTRVNAEGFPEFVNYYVPSQYVVEPDGRFRIIRPGGIAGFEVFYVSFRSKFLVLTPQ